MAEPSLALFKAECRIHRKGRFVRTSSCWQILELCFGRTSVTRAVTAPQRCDCPSVRRSAGWALAIFVGLLSGTQCTAAETLTLDGATPTLIFQHNVSPFDQW